MKDAIAPDEITFIALPSQRNLQDRGATEETLRRYAAAQWRIRQAQEQCAVVAVSILRPEEYRVMQQQYLRICSEARHARNEKLLKVFSEKCTKGL